MTDKQAAKMKNIKIDKKLTSAQEAPEINKDTLRSALELLTPTEEETQSLRSKLLAGLDAEVSGVTGVSAADASGYKLLTERTPLQRRIAYAGGGLAACLCVVMLVSLIANGGLNLGESSTDGAGDYVMSSSSETADTSDTSDADSIAAIPGSDNNSEAHDNAWQDIKGEDHLGEDPLESIDQTDNGLTSPVSDSESPISMSPQDVSSIKGLPTIPSTWGMRYECITTQVDDDLPSVYMLSDIDDFYLSTQRVAIVRVTSAVNVGQRKYDPQTTMLSTQISALSVLLQAGDIVPASLKLTQYLAEGCDPGGVSNLVRKDGVYVLNLWKSEDGDGYYAFDDLGVLFEVDDLGRVWSHSNMPGLKKYDGKPLTELWSDIEACASDKTPR